jgi:hypothetical protein
MVDTTVQIFYPKASESPMRYETEEVSVVKELMNYIDKVTHKPIITTEIGSYENYIKKYEVWDSLRVFRVDSLKEHDPAFNKLFDQAIKSIEKGRTNNELEEYVGRYYSKKLELELKRNRIVVGGCSRDNAPRYHAQRIALLAAETVNWEIFLRAHLDIMNDRFERMSDASYAWEGRKTYIKELEVLDINVLDLLLGISLRIENPSKNHYYGSISRLGRALSETGKNAKIEAKILQMISDRTLDDYNRILMYYLFLNYNYNLESKEKQAENKIKLTEAVKTLPAYLATKIKTEE